MDKIKDAAVENLPVTLTFPEAVELAENIEKIDNKELLANVQAFAGREDNMGIMRVSAVDVQSLAVYLDKEAASIKKKLAAKMKRDDAKEDKQIASLKDELKKRQQRIKDSRKLREK